MSLTNPNTVVTEQRLSEFYQGILPYLGGMPEMLANKFSKGDLYSTEEKMIGQWTDGKPLYQKTIIGTVPNGWGDTAHNVANVDLVVDVTCGIIHSNSYITVGGATDTGRFLCQVGRTNVALYVAPSSYAGDDFICTFKYTKTTDSAISIGSDTDYSTEEKIIGTWIDGKPLYQKTIVDTFPILATDYQVAHKEISVSTLNIDTMVLMGGIFDNDNIYINIGIGSGVISANLTTGVSSIWYNKSDARINLEHNRAPWSNRNCIITIQYTKTN